jgi:hypothetical protein
VYDLYLVELVRELWKRYYSQDDVPISARATAKLHSMDENGAAIRVGKRRTRSIHPEAGSRGGLIQEGVTMQDYD